MSISISKLIKIDRRKSDPVYLQIAYQVINAVRMGVLGDGDRLPSSRSLAEELGLHRKTIVAGLEELRTQGWLETRPGVGTYIKIPNLQIKEKLSTTAAYRPSDYASFSFKENFILDIPELYSDAEYYFSDGNPDYRLIPPRELVRFYVSVLNRKRNLHSFSFQGGNNSFGEQLSYYLNATRGLHLSKDYLLPIKGRQQAYSLLSLMLVAKGDIVLVGEMGYFVPNMVFNQAGAQLQTIPVDEDGIVISHIRQNYQKGQIKLLCVNTFSQHPTTRVLSDLRRTELLRLAEEYGFLIIEDAWDEEFVLDKSAQSDSLLKMDKKGRVVQTGVFGGFLAPDFQMNYLLGPKDFIREGWKYRLLIENPNRMMEQALAEMISEGDIHRYRRKFQRVLLQRKKEFKKVLDQLFSEEVSVVAPINGLAYWIEFKKEFSLIGLQKKAMKLDLFIPRICLYQNPQLTAIRLGFAHLNEQEMEKALNVLKKAYISALK